MNNNLVEERNSYLLVITFRRNGLNISSRILKYQIGHILFTETWLEYTLQEAGKIEGCRKKQTKI